MSDSNPASDLQYVCTIFVEYFNLWDFLVLSLKKECCVIKTICDQQLL